MKKYLIYVAILLAGLFGLEAVNTRVLLSLHELSFYYTWSGFWRTMLLITVEAIVLYHPVKWFVDKHLMVAYRETFEKNES